MTTDDLQTDLWLSEKLGKPAFNLRHNFTQFELDDFTDSPAFVSAKVPVVELRSHLYLQQQGFKVIDVSLQYTGEPSQGKSLKGCPSLRIAQKEDEQAICQLAAEEFLQNRFHQDPNVPAVVAAKIKRDWVANFFLGKRGDLLLVATMQNVICGFLLLIIQPSHLIIDLIAVSKRFRQQGIGKSLILFAWEQYREPSQEILVGTQLSNPASMALYSHLGLELTSANYLLHLHR